jgi:hypothetical protein
MTIAQRLSDENLQRMATRVLEDNLKKRRGNQNKLS